MFRYRILLQRLVWNDMAPWRSSHERLSDPPTKVRELPRALEIGRLDFDAVLPVEPGMWVEERPRMLLSGGRWAVLNPYQRFWVLAIDPPQTPCDLDGTGCALAAREGGHLCGALRVSRHGRGEHVSMRHLDDEEPWITLEDGLTYCPSCEPDRRICPRCGRRELLRYEYVSHDGGSAARVVVEQCSASHECGYYAESRAR